MGSKNILILAAIFIAATLFYEYDKAVNFHLYFLDQALFLLQAISLNFIFIKVLLYTTHRWFYKKTAAEFPKILENLIALAVWLIMILLILSFRFGISVNTVVATSGVSIAVLGFALRSLLLDFFSGIAISVERAFDIGDWIEIQKDVVGKVIGMNWRAVRIVTLENKEIVIPNNELASKFFINYNKPSPYFRLSTTIVLGYEITSFQAERILLSAANMSEEVISAPNKPTVSIKSYTQRGAEWELMFWINDYRKKIPVSYEVDKNILRNLYISGVEVPPEISKIYHSPLKKSGDFNNIEYFLQRIDLFVDLTKTEMENLSKNAKKEIYLAGKHIVEAGDSGDSLFIIVEGLVTVSVKNGEDEQLDIAKLCAGDFFGEMSLLTGEARSATVMAYVDTVVFEIGKEDLRPILQMRKEVLDSMSAILAERKLHNDKKLSTISLQQKDIIIGSLKDQIKEKIILFFGLIQKYLN